MPSESLKDAMRMARIESAARSHVVVDLRDAELARLELLNEALDPLFAEIPDGVELFDRGMTTGDTPRLWIDMVAHVVMGRDKRLYRFVQDSRYGRNTLAESTEIEQMVATITHYVASRMVERERALDDKPAPTPMRTRFVTREVLSEDRPDDRPVERAVARSNDQSETRWRLLQMFILGLIVGSLALFTALWIAASRS